MEQTLNEREKLLELLAGQHRPEIVARRSQEMLKILLANFPTEHAGVLALALAEAADKTLYAIFKRARDNQENFTGHLSRIIRPS